MSQIESGIDPTSKPDETGITLKQLWKFTYPRGPFGLRRKKATDTTSISASLVTDARRTVLLEVGREYKTRRPNSLVCGWFRAEPVFRDPCPGRFRSLEKWKFTQKSSNRRRVAELKRI
jgi:hypothetical protein